MNRISKARSAYLSQDVKSIKNAHSKRAIHRSIHHHETHIRNFSLPEIILGGQDGLVNVLGIILGVAAATASSQMVIIAGLAATFAESISMAAVAYTSQLTEADYYQSEYEREKWEIEHVPEGEREEVRAMYENYGFRGDVLDSIVQTVTSDKSIWLKVMMEQELKLEPIDRKSVLSRAILVGVSAFVGSLIPLFPYFFAPVRFALPIGLILSALTLFIVGHYKAQKTIGRSFVKQGTEMMVIGMLSAFAGYIIGMLLQVK